MVIVQINQTYKIGSTGKIMADLNDVITKHGHEGYMVAGYALDDKVDSLYSLNEGNYAFAIRKNILISRISGKMGYRQEKETIKAIEWIDSKNPDVIHLHNIHGDWINIQLLFEYIKKKKIPVVWTLHDCWAFTGRCSHFELCKCEKWKTGCYDCSNNKVYPITYFFDFSKKMWQDKKKWFSDIENMKIVTPSYWLKQYVDQSFLGNYRTFVIHNGIDTKSFSRRKNLKTGKKIILGVASSWTANKGFFDFIKLDSMLNHDEYEIIMVGLNSRQMKKIPKTITGIKRTNSIQDLVDIYSKASVFFNPTYLDNFPTTNLEALACGTPVVTYRTGGSPESVPLQCGKVLEQGDVLGMLEFIKNREFDHFDKNILIDYAKEKFDKYNAMNKYLKLYENG